MFDPLVKWYWLLTVHKKSTYVGRSVASRFKSPFVISPFTQSNPPHHLPTHHKQQIRNSRTFNLFNMCEIFFTWRLVVKISICHCLCVWSQFIFSHTEKPLFLWCPYAPEIFMGIFVISFALLLCFWFLIFIALVYICVYIVIILHNIFLQFLLLLCLLLKEREVLVRICIIRCNYCFLPFRSVIF